MEGEFKLMLAVLEDAIRCYLRNIDARSGERRRQFIEVKGWIERDGPAARAAGVFGFERLCEALGIEPATVSERLRALTIEDLPSRRYQMRRHRPLSSLRNACRRKPGRRSRSFGA